MRRDLGNRPSPVNRGRLFCEPSSPSPFLRAASLSCEPQKLPPRNPKKDTMPYCGLYLYIQKRWPCNMFNCEPKCFCVEGYLLVKHPSVNNIHVYSRGDVLLLSVQNSAKFLLFKGKYTLKDNFKDSSDGVDKK